MARRRKEWGIESTEIIHLLSTKGQTMLNTPVLGLSPKSTKDEGSSYLVAR